MVTSNSSLLGEIHTPQDLSNFPQVQFANSVGNLGNSVNTFLNNIDINKNIIATLPCYTSLQAFMAVNDVVTFIPSKIASIGKFERIEMDISPIEFNVIVGIHRKSSENPAIKWMLDLILESVSDFQHLIWQKC